jgi:hypothetical protein
MMVRPRDKGKKNFSSERKSRLSLQIFQIVVDISNSQGYIKAIISKRFNGAACCLSIFYSYVII